MTTRTAYPLWPNRAAKPTVSWSAESAYAECPRKWFNEYHSNLLPQDQSRNIRAEKPLLASALLTGQVVHTVIDAAIRQYKKTGQTPAEQLSNARDVCRNHFRQYNIFSHQYLKAFQNRTTLPRAKDIAPIESIFRGNSLSKEEGVRLLDTTETCITNFLHSSLYERLMEESPDHLIPQPRGPLSASDFGDMAIPWYWTENIAVYASYDLLIVKPDEATIIDWKTGKQEGNEERTERQLNYYAPFVTAQYGIQPESIELIAAWIGEGTKHSSYEAHPYFLERQTERWQQWRNDLRQRLLEVEEDRTKLDILFPMNEQVNRCRYCKYQSCPGYERHRNLNAGTISPEEDPFYESEEL